MLVVVGLLLAGFSFLYFVIPGVGQNRGMLASVLICWFPFSSEKLKMLSPHDANELERAGETAQQCEEPSLTP